MPSPILPAAPAAAHIPEADAINATAAHHSVVCPTCSSALQGHKCKMICRTCGYYLSCSDFY